MKHELLTDALQEATPVYSSVSCSLSWSHSSREFAGWSYSVNFELGCLRRDNGLSSPQRHIPGYTMKKNPLVILHHCPLFISLHNPSCTHVFLCSPEYYRHIMFILLCFTCFKKKKTKLKVCANFLLSKSISTIVSTVSAHFVSLGHTLVILLVSQTFSFLFQCSVVTDLWCYSCKKTATDWRLRWWLEFLAIKYF